jgi:hypothetical protein
MLPGNQYENAPDIFKVFYQEKRGKTVATFARNPIQQIIQNASSSIQSLTKNKIWCHFIIKK